MEGKMEGKMEVRGRMEGMHGRKKDPKLQRKYNAMPEPEQNRCDWLQKLSNQFLLYYIERILGSQCITTIKDLYSVAVDNGRDFAWQDVTDHLKKQLLSHDPFYLFCATHCMR